MQGDQIKLPKLGWVRLRLSRPVPEPFAIKQVRVIRKPSGYYVNLSLQADVDVPELQPSGQPLGIDLGLDRFLATSDGELIDRRAFSPATNAS